jgi:hypothetical protein
MRLLAFGRRKRPKKYRLVRLAARLENFLISVWSKKLVVVTSTLLVITGYFLNNFFVGIPEQLRETDQQHELRAQQIMQEFEKYSDTASKLQVFIDALNDSLNNIKGLGSGIKIVSAPDDKTSYSVDSAGAQSCLTKIQDTRNRLITAIAALKTSNFQRPDLVDFYEGYEDDLRAIDPMLASFEAFYQSVLKGNLSDLAEATNRSHEYRLKFQEAVEVLAERYKLTLQKMANINKGLDLLKSEQDFGEFALAVRALSLLILIGLTALCAILTLKVRKPKPPPFPMTQAQCDISGSQRQKYQVIRDARRKK